MRAFKWLCLGCIIGTLVAFIWTDRQLKRYARDAAAESAIWKARYAEKAIDAETKDTVWRSAKARVDTLRDSVPVWQHDTTYIKQYVARSDEALQACTELADSCKAFRATADSTIGAVTKERDAFRTLAEARRITWKERFGISCGYSVVKLGPDLKAGPSCGLGVRLWP